MSTTRANVNNKNKPPLLPQKVSATGVVQKVFDNCSGVGKNSYFCKIMGEDTEEFDGSGL